MKRREAYGKAETTMKTIPEAQKDNAALYRAHARRTPWNSKTRQRWLKLAEEAEACAARHEKP